MAAISSFLALEINTTTSANLLKNHSAAFSLWGWTKAGGAGYGVNGFSLSNVSSTLTTDKVPVVAGQWVGLTGYAKAVSVATKGFTAKIRYYNVGGTLIGSAVQIAGPIIPAAGAAFAATSSSQAPAGAVTMTLELDTAGASTGGLYIKSLMLTTAGTSGAANQTLPADNWVNILGTALNIVTESGNKLNGVEDVLTPGFLIATITDPALDPATSSSLKKGRPIRLQATASGTKAVWQGVIDTADTEYTDNQAGPSARRITITAVDVARALDNNALSTTVTGGFSGQVAAAAFAARLPTYDGSVTPEAGTGVEANDANASSTDWIRRACNTHGGYVWIDQAGVIQQRLIGSLATSPAYTFSDTFSDVGALYYTKINLNFGSRSLVNALNIERFNVDEIEADSKTYGPYVAEASEFEHGRITEKIEITSGSPSAIAGVILPVFATPKRFPKEIQVDALADLAQVLSVNKYDPVRVKRLALYDDVVRVLHIRHEISASDAPGAPNGTWITKFTLRPLETATAVTITNPPAGADTGPGDIDTGAGTGFPRMGQVSRTAAYSLAVSGTTYTLPFDTVDIADGIAWDNTNKQFVITRAGRYYAQVQAIFASNATGSRTLILQANGATEDQARNLITGSATILNASKALKLSPGDTVSATAAQTSGGSLAMTVGTSLFLQLVYIGP